LAGNPLSLSRQHARRAKLRITRYLQPDLWQEVNLSSSTRCPARPTGNDYFRARWLFTLVYPGGLRIPEVSANTMGRFFARRDADGHERWWLDVLGKGDKERPVSATNAMAAAHS
jgi:site-specific recombinase XerD